MSGRRDSQVDDVTGLTDLGTGTIVTDSTGEIQQLDESGALLFYNSDLTLLGTSVERVESAGIITTGTTERYRNACRAIENGDCSRQFQTGIYRSGDLDPIEYSVTLSPREDGGFQWELADTGLRTDTETILSQLHAATKEIGNQEAVRNIYGALEHWSSIILRPTGLDIRRAVPESEELIRMTRRNATIPIDDRTVVDLTDEPYATVWPDNDSIVQAPSDEPFASVAHISIGRHGVISMGRVGTTISESDLHAMETLADCAESALGAIESRSRVDTQEAELDRYETLVESIPDPVYSTDTNGRITFVNRAFEAAFGFSLEECRGMHITEFTSGESSDEIRSEIRHLLDPANENYTQVSATGVKADGREAELEASIGVVFHNGEFDGVVGVLRDVTERKRQEEISAVMNRALRHNLRTSINNIIGYAELTEHGQGDTGEYMQVIREEGEWLMKLGDTMRAVRRSIDANGHERLSMTIQELLDPLLAEYHNQHPAVSITTEYECQKQIQAGSTLQVAFDNVIENAIEHNDNPEPSVAIRSLDAVDGWVEVEIEDNGPGIDTHEVDLVMGETEITQLQHGTGIGLWLARWIVEIFEGEFHIETGEDGTTVTIRLQEET